MEIHRGVDFPRGESGRGNEDNNIAAAVASVNADTTNSGNCMICEGGRDGGGASKHHDAHHVHSVLLRCIWKRSVWIFLPAGKSPLQEYYSYNQSYILDLWY